MALNKFTLQKNGIDVAKCTQSSSGVVMVEWGTANLPDGQLAKTDHWESIAKLKAAYPNHEVVYPPDRIEARNSLIETVKAAAREAAQQRATAIIETHQAEKAAKLEAAKAEKAKKVEENA